ncbi:MAG TPA: SH3 domain-containing protein [Candidatus Eremiobacteraeota bacterium]|nr:MAG: translocation protein TolB [bacterium ADurb.Bin363]HPZ08288.1 SH3 domain-containing protein [Candidatus Eremiobacteraeota bacterium]
MKRNNILLSFLLIALFLYFFSMSYNNVMGKAVEIYVNASDVNIREGPGLDKNILEQLQKGEPLILIDIQGDWCYVEYKGDKKGWINKEFVTISSSSSEIKITPTPVLTPLIITPKAIPKSRIIFTTSSGLKIINSDGTGLKDLTSTEGDNFPIWSPDGNKIAFINYRTGRTLYIINSDGTGRKKLTENLSVIPLPDWSKNGKSIIFSAEFLENLYYTDVFHVNPETGNIKSISQNKNAPDLGPVYSPDNNLIAFTSRRDKNAEIYIMKSDGTNQLNLTNHPAEDIFSCWSPGGKSLLFTSNRDSDYKDLKVKYPPREVYLLKLESFKVLNLTNHPSDDYNPVISPDGSKIAFLSDRKDGTSCPDIFIMKAGGKDVLQLTDIKGDKNDISWSPDSSDIVFHLNQQGNNYIYITGKQKTRLLTEGFSPQWCPKK